MGPPVRVLLVDDDEDFTRATSRSVERAEGLELAGVAASVALAGPACERTEPDVAVVDVNMPEGGGAAACRAILARRPGVRIVAVSGVQDRDSVVAMLGSGARGYVLKGTDPAELIRTIHEVARGGTPLGAAVAGTVVSELAGRLREDDDVERRREEQAERVRGVLTARGLRAHLQPIVDLRTGQVVGAEALARFDGDRGPGAWFGDAAEAGLTAELEQLAIEVALEELDKLPSAAFLSLNVSPQTLTDVDLFADAPRSLTSRLVLEITEHVPIEDFEALLPVLQRLRDQGIRVAIDDMGAGYTSLRDTLRVDPDFIKLDRSLVADIDQDAGKRALASALIAFAGQTGATVIAEGIETPGELQALRGVKVAYGQGFLLSRPQAISGGAYDGGVKLPAPGEGVSLVDDEGTGTAVLMGPARGDGAEDPAAARWRSASDAVQATLAYLEQQVPDAVLLVAHLDYATKRWQVLDARRGAARGLEAGTSTALDASPCYHVAAARAPGSVADATQDAVLGALDLVRATDLRSLACMPVQIRSGARVASVAACSSVPAALGPQAQRAVLTAAAVLSDAFGAIFAGQGLGAVGDHLRGVCETDWLTGVPNRQRLLAVLKQHWRQARRCGLPTGVVTVEVVGLPALAASAGQARAELVLRTLARTLTHVIQDSDVAGRTGEASFAVVLPGHDPVLTERLEDRLRMRLEASLGPAAGEISIDTRSHALGEVASPADVLRAGMLGVVRAAAVAA